MQFRLLVEEFYSDLSRCKQKQRGLRGLLCRWPSITEREMHITAQGPCLRNDLYCVECDVKLSIPYHTETAGTLWLQTGGNAQRRQSLLKFTGILQLLSSTLCYLVGEGVLSPSAEASGGPNACTRINR